jgi:hypothetical protein
MYPDPDGKCIGFYEKIKLNYCSSQCQCVNISNIIGNFAHAPGQWYFCTTIMSANAAVSDFSAPSK